MSRDTDVEQLRTDIEQIKEAMGIQERYRSATSLWLLFGVTVPIAAALSQYVFMERLTPWLHTVVWVGVLGGGGAVWYLFAGETGEFSVSSAGKPNIALQFALVFLSVYPVVFVVSQYVGDLGYVASGTLWQALIVIFLGIAYGMLGSSLRAYRVRWRDRAVFYVGTLWMVLLGLAIPLVSVLRTWPYAAFGGVYFVYAVGAYLVLTR